MPPSSRGSVRSDDEQADSAGFAAIDALMALTILATTIAFAINAVSVGQRAARAASETRQAQALMEALLDAPIRQPGTYHGKSSGLAWTVNVTPRLPNTSPLLCDTKVEVAGRRAQQTYQLATAETCPKLPEAEQ